MTQIFRYAHKTVVASYARSAIGLGVTLGPLALLQPAASLSAVLVVGAGLFLVYSARSIARHSMQIVLDDSGIEARGLFGAAVAWNELRSVELNYYTTRSDRSNGWIELVVRGARDSIRVESALEGFAAIAARVAREALERGRPLDERTRTHLAALGVDLGPERTLALEPMHRAHHA